MIVARAGGGLRLITQVAHQAQCGVLVSEWGNAAFARPEPWEPVVAAAGAHDEGWREWERHPAVLPEGAPQGFADMEIGEHVSIHRASARSAAAHGPRTALLVGMHGAGLVMRRMGLDGPMPPLADRPAPAAGLVREHALQARRLRADIGEGPALGAWSWAAYRILQAVDLLSLYLTWRGLTAGEAWTLARVPRYPGDEAGVPIALHPSGDRSCTLDPWPFAAARVDAPVEARVIADRPYRDADDLSGALADAAPQVVVFSVTPA